MSKDAVESLLNMDNSIHYLERDNIPKGISFFLKDNY